jgi:hypothetical protein
MGSNTATNSSSRIPPGAAQAAHGILPLFGVEPKSQQQLLQEGHLTALVRGLPHQTLVKVSGDRAQAKLLVHAGSTHGSSAAVDEFQHLYWDQAPTPAPARPSKTAGASIGSWGTRL